MLSEALRFVRRRVEASLPSRECYEEVGVLRAHGARSEWPFSVDRARNRP